LFSQHLTCLKKNKRKVLIDFKHRLALCKLAFQDIPNVTVSELEKVCFDNIAAKKRMTTEEDKGQLRVALVDLLETLIPKYEEKTSCSGDFNDISPLAHQSTSKLSELPTRKEYSMALVADTFMDLTAGKWKRSKDVVRLIEGRILVIQRIILPTPIHMSSNEFSKDDVSSAVIKEDDKCSKEYVSDEELQKRIQAVKEEFGSSISDNIRIVRIPGLASVSSTLVRATRNEEYLSKVLQPKVLEYIKAHQLYSFS